MRGIMWPEPDGLVGTAKALCLVLPEERLLIIPATILVAVLYPFIRLWLWLRGVR